MAYDAFVEIDGCPSESTDDKHSGWLEIMSFSFGVTQAIGGSASAGGGRNAQRCDISDLSIVKGVCKATPTLFLDCCKGRHIPKVTVELCQATGDKEPYLKIEMEDVIISSWRPGGACQGGEAKPLEEVSFNAAKTTVTYVEIDHNDGSVKGPIAKWWDTTTNKGG